MLQYSKMQPANILADFQPIPGLYCRNVGQAAGLKLFRTVTNFKQNVEWLLVTPIKLGLL